MEMEMEWNGMEWKWNACMSECGPHIRSKVARREKFYINKRNCIILARKASHLSLALIPNC